MAIEINFENFSTQTEETLTQRVQFVFSPLNELFRSLHILLNPRHHGLHMKWIVETQQKMTSALYNDLHYFRLIYELGTPTLFLPSTEIFITNLDNEIVLLRDKLNAVTDDEMVNLLTVMTKNRENSFIPKLAKGLEWGDFKLSHNENIISDILKDSDAVYKRFFNFISQYRTLIFDDYWYDKNIEQILLEEIESASQIMHRVGFKGFLNQLQIERMQFKDNKLMILKPFDANIQLKNADSLLFVPSYFTYPHLFAETFSKGIFITYDCLSNRHKKLDIEQLSKVFFALSDPARIELVSHLHEEKNTTQGLAQLLSYTQSNVSKQLRLLKEAELVASEKQGKYVFYATTSLFEQVLPDFNLLVNQSKYKI